MQWLDLCSSFVLRFPSSAPTPGRGFVLGKLLGTLWAAFVWLLWVLGHHFSSCEFTSASESLCAASPFLRCLMEIIIYSLPAFGTSGGCSTLQEFSLKCSMEEFGASEVCVAPGSWAVPAAGLELAGQGSPCGQFWEGFHLVSVAMWQMSLQKVARLRQNWK